MIDQTDTPRTPTEQVTATPEEAYFSAPVDAEHAGIRAVGCASAIVVLVISFFAFNLLIPQGAFIAVVIGFIIGSVTIFITERLLKGRWPSGRQIIVAPDRIAIARHSKIEYVVDPSQHVNTLAWYFDIQRSARAPRGWYVVGFALEQEGNMVPVYTFMPPDDFEKAPYIRHFERLQRQSAAKRNDSSSQELRLAGKQRRLREAEELRGMDGAEMTRTDFDTLIQTLQRYFREWMPA